MARSRVRCGEARHEQCARVGGSRLRPHPPLPTPATVPDIPHEATKLSNVRKTIARRLTESKQTVPHIYLTVDIRLDALLKLRADLNKGLETRGVKLSVNDLIIKALAVSLIQVPKCNVMFTPDQLISFSRADISVGGVYADRPHHADHRRSRYEGRRGDLDRDEGPCRARSRRQAAAAGYQGGTASLSNMGMYGIKPVRRGHQPAAGA